MQTERADQDNDLCMDDKEAALDVVPKNKQCNDPIIVWRNVVIKGDRLAD
jgi:hypothetical protein